MSYRLSLEPKAALSLKQTQRLMMSPKMQQSLDLLQLPILELAPLIEHELTQNPLLEYAEEVQTEEALTLETQEPSLDQEMPTAETLVQLSDEDFWVLSRLDEDLREHFSQSGPPPCQRPVKELQEEHNFQESLVTATPSFYDSLMEQAHILLKSPDDLTLAQTIIGNLDEYGLFSESLEDTALLHKTTKEHVISVLQQIQEFAPPGIAAQSQQESLLLQLLAKGKGASLAYQVVQHHFDDLLHNRLPKIGRALKKSLEELQQALHDIASLSFHPKEAATEPLAQTIVPDASIHFEGEVLHIEIRGEEYPELQLNPRYLALLQDPHPTKETNHYLKEKLSSAKWLIRNLAERSKTLYRVVEEIAKRQHVFLNTPHGTLAPLTFKVLAESLQVHESTIARAVTHKYLSCSRGVFPLKFFFSGAYQKSDGEELSSTTVKDRLAHWIAKENKAKPYSDEKLSLLLAKEGIPCARRTVAKYRHLLGIASASQRRQY